MKRIAILMTAFFLMFAVTTPAFADDTGKKSPQIATTIADDFEAVSPLDLAPPILVATCNAKDNIASVEDCAGYDIVSAATFSKNNQQASFNIFSESTSKTAIATAGNITVANYVINRAAKNTRIIQANIPQAQCKDATATTRMEDCECDIVISFEASSTDQLLTAPTDEAVTEVPNVVPRE